MPTKDHPILARWRAQLAGINCSPLAFFALVQDAISEAAFPQVEFSDVVHREGGLFTADRIYLRVRHRDMYFDVSAFVAGRYLVVGYWLLQDPPGVRDLLAEIPGIAFVVDRAIVPATYYAVDAIEAFQHAVHDAILRVCDDLSNWHNTSLLTEEQRQPIWEDIW